MWVCNCLDWRRQRTELPGLGWRVYRGRGRSLGRCRTSQSAWGRSPERPQGQLPGRSREPREARRTMLDLTCVIFFLLGAHLARGESGPCFWRAGGAQKLRLDACVKETTSSSGLSGATAISGAKCRCCMNHEPGVSRRPTVRWGESSRRGQHELRSHASPTPGAAHGRRTLSFGG
jgi:hypothetical protein